MNTEERGCGFTQSTTSQVLERPAANHITPQAV